MLIKEIYHDLISMAGRWGLSFVSYLLQVRKRKNNAYNQY